MCFRFFPSYPFASRISFCFILDSIIINRLFHHSHLSAYC